jgi:hypothetical protein
MGADKTRRTNVPSAKLAASVSQICSMGAVWFMPKLSMRRRPELRESNVPLLPSCKAIQERRARSADSLVRKSSNDLPKENAGVFDRPGFK